jgi:hypothetical protein
MDSTSFARLPEGIDNPALAIRIGSSESFSACDPSKSEAGKWQTPESDDTGSGLRGHISSDSLKFSCKKSKSNSESNSSSNTESVSAENQSLRNQLLKAQSQVQVCHMHTLIYE